MTRLCWPLTLFFSSSLLHSPRSLLSVSPVHTLCMNTDYRWIWNPLTSFGYCVLIIILCSVSLTLVIQLLCQAINFCFMTGLFASPANVDLFFFPHWIILVLLFVCLFCFRCRCCCRCCLHCLLFQTKPPLLMLTYRCCQLLLLLLLRLFYSLLLRIENIATCCRLWVSWTRHVLASGAGDMVAM